MTRGGGNMTRGEEGTSSLNRDCREDFSSDSSSSNRLYVFSSWFLIFALSCCLQICKIAESIDSTCHLFCNFWWSFDNICILDPFPFDANLCWETEFMLGASHFKGNVWLHEVRTQIVTPAWVLRPKKGLLSWSHSTLCGTLRLSLVLSFWNPKFGYTCV